MIDRRSYQLEVEHLLSQIDTGMHDLRLLKAAGQNRLMPHCFEFVDGVQLQPTQVQRSFVGRVTWGA